MIISKILISMFIIVYLILILTPLFDVKEMFKEGQELAKRSAAARLGGLFIGLGCIAYLNNVNNNKILAAFLFSIGLISVILLGADLFTGKIGYVNKKTIPSIIHILFENIFAIMILGLLYGEFKSNNPEIIIQIAENKLNLSILELFFKSIGCGVCIFLAVELYKRTKSIFVIVLGVMVFILSGFEHCIADVFYFASYFMVKEQNILNILKTIGYILIIILGNSFGSILINLLIKIKEVKVNEE